VIRDGVDGRLLDPRDVEAWAAALRALRDDPAARRRMGEAAAERVRAAYAPQTQVERLLDLYARVS
jgi:glycosyltransferase involved in cell wall biosynthesis